MANGLIVVDTSVLTQLQHLIDSGGPVYNAVVRLYKNEVELSGQVVLGDFDTADFPGYADSAPIEWTDPQTVNGQARTQSLRPVRFEPSEGTDQYVYGWLLLSEAGDLIGCQEFSPRKRVIGTASAIQFLVEYTAVSVL